eukprot:g17890.t1
MTPVQRSYYDIESIWRDDNQDYEKDFFLRTPRGSLKRPSRLDHICPRWQELTDPNDITPRRDEDEEDLKGAFEEEQDFYEEDEEDPFWS